MDRRDMHKRIAQHPNAVRFDDLAKLLEAYGWELVRISSSHHIFGRGSQTLSVPFRRPHVLPVYVKRVLALLAEDNNDE